MADSITLVQYLPINLSSVEYADFVVGSTDIALPSVQITRERPCQNASMGTPANSLDLTMAPARDALDELLNARDKLNRGPC